MAQQLNDLDRSVPLPNALNRLTIPQMPRTLDYRPVRKRSRWGRAALRFIWVFLFGVLLVYLALLAFAAYLTYVRPVVVPPR